MKNFYLLILLCGLTSLLAAQPVFNWTSQEIKAGRNLQKMTVYNDKAVVAGFGRTFVKSVDNGSTWKDVGLLSTTFDFIDMSFKGNTGYVVSNRSKLYDAFPDPYTNGIILQTSDGGTTWKNVDLAGLGSGTDPALNPTTPGCFGYDFQSVGCANDTVAYCYLRWLEFKPTETSGTVTHSGIFRTTNKGSNWKNISGDLGGTVISTIVFADTTGYIGGNKKLYKTSSKTETLTDIFANLQSAGAGYVNDITVIDRNEIYVITVSNGIYKSTNGGDSFTKYNITGITGGNDIFKVNDNSLIMTGSSSKSRISNDAGVTWADAKLTVSVWEVGGIINDSLFVLAQSDIYKIKIADLTAGNFVWVKQNISTGNNIHKAHILSADKALLIGLGQTFKMTSNKGITWNEMTLPDVPLFDAQMDFNGLRNFRDTAYACMNRFYMPGYSSSSTATHVYWSGGVFKTTDNWSTFSSVDAALIGKDEGTDPSKNPNLAACNGFNTSVIEYAGNNVVLLWGRWYDVSGATKAEHSRVFRSADGGKNWKVVSDDFGTVYVMDIKFRGDTGYVAGNKILLKSVDRGSTFTDIYPVLKAVAGSDPFINAITLGPGNELFLTTTAAVFRSPDGGASFTKLSTTTGGNDFYRFDQDSWVVMGTTSKSLLSNDGGGTWVSANPGATIYEIGGVWNGNLYALGQGKLYRTPVAGLNLGTYATPILSPSSLNVLYKSGSVELVSGEKPIDRCMVYSITGQLVSLTNPMSLRHELHYGSFTPGIYIARTLAGGKLFVNKIVIP